MKENERTIAHYDLDAFFVNVECLKNPSLKGKPLMVGGKSDRAVVAACSYEARKFGIRSAMPMKLARRLCPQAMIISGDMESYSYYSRLVTDVIRDNVPQFEKASVDEFYVDLTGMDRFFGSRSFSQDLRSKVTKETGLPISNGMAANKLVSKVATDEAKPNGQLVIPFGNEKRFLAPLAIEKLPMAGPKTTELLRQMGVVKIKTLSEIPVEMMENLMGKPGIELWRRANGIDESPVVPYSEQKSISTESTFESDTIDIRFLQAKLVQMTEKIAFELRQQNKLTGCVTVKIRYSDFNTVTKQCTIAYTALDHLLLQTVKELFSKLYDRRLLVRLIGVRFTHLVPGNYQISLFDDTDDLIRLYQEIDKLNGRFGRYLIMRASGFL
ncbi:DNA polymerase IV [Flavisolibacter ginsengisoli]|jgi:DNA polymerase-4|uniref:DNA polymerase IV n=1 Tax=Flavisolibacter ginsengisoli DSM 18119 TaxID=1121884 RepID=A0A1M5FMQ6_9BACT|nr:DNA polymerase IV [Flavisolibacter ginsengisoli]SHF92704.1 DNA polymerase-4 [Flavisolibacter ginsengisoli DSM 18119]